MQDDKQVNEFSIIQECSPNIPIRGLGQNNTLHDVVVVLHDNAIVLLLCKQQHRVPCYIINPGTIAFITGGTESDAVHEESYWGSRYTNVT